MLRNVEVKAKIKDFNKTLDIARSLCGADEEILLQEDTFFYTPTGRLKLRNFRDGSTSQLIFYKRPDIETLKTSEYSICAVENHKELSNILKSALGVKGTVKKTRHLFLYDQTRIHVDQVEGLGNFLEVEVVLASTQSVEEGEKVANYLIQEFGISREDLIKGAYLDLLIEK